MATNYGAWTAGMQAAGSGSQNARLLSDIMDMRRRRRMEREEMDLRRQAMAPVDVSNIPGLEKIGKVERSAIPLLAHYLDTNSANRRTDIAEYKAKQQQLALSPDEKRMLQDMEVADAQMRNIAEAYQKTPISAAKGTVASGALGLPLIGGSALMQNVFPDEATYRRKLRIAVQQRGKAISGQAMSEKEAERIASTFPPMGSDPKQFNESLRNFYLEMQQRMNAIPEARHISGYEDVAEQMRKRIPQYNPPVVPETSEADPTGMKEKLRMLREKKAAGK